MIRKTTKFLFALLMGVFLATSFSCGFALAQETGANEAAGNTEDTYSLTPESAQDFLQRNQLLNTEAETWEEYDCYHDTYSNDSDDKYCIKSDAKSGGVYAEDASVYTHSNGVQGCPVVAVEWFKNQDCKFCSLLSIAYKASDYVASISFEKFAHSFALLTIVVFVVWIAFKTLGYVSLFTAQDAAKYLTNILIQGFKFLLAFFALYNYKELYDLLVLPLLSFGLNFADAFVANGMSVTEYGLLKQENGKYVRESVELMRNNDLLSLDMYVMMEKFAMDVNSQFSLLHTIGHSLRCLSGKYMFNDFSSVEEGSRFGLGLGCFLYGSMFGVLGLLLSLAFVFYLFDAVVQVGIFGAIMPFAIACWPFKMFTKSANNAFKIFMNSVFTFMMAGVVVRVCIQLLSGALSSMGSEKYDGTVMLVQAIDTVDTASLQQIVGQLNIKTLVFAFACLSGFMLVGKVGQLTDKFAKGGISPIASGLATTAASGIKGAAKKIAGPTLERAQSDFNKVVGKGVGAVGKLGKKLVGGTAKLAAKGAAKGADNAVYYSAKGVSKGVRWVSSKIRGKK
ncbi:MAG: hypothetical protein IKK52_00990 [Alphaproteobacteria bacterium]|nr:hypothetical protein [Alphaproteobacteria bacterium]